MSVSIVGAELVLTMAEGEGPLGAQHDAVVCVEGGAVSYVGPASGAPACAESVDAAGCVVMPALVDCHTHSVWAGSRADEFRRRLAGEDYSAILEAGGGILSTVRATRAASHGQLLEACAARLRGMVARGVGTVEVKSGYGLSPEHELRLLKVAREAGELVGVDVVPTFLGAHTVPLAFRSDRPAYVQQVIEEQLPRVAGVAECIDVYVDRGAFTLEEGERILQAGRDVGLHVRVHAEQVTATGAAAMAARLGALSADHLEHLDAAGVEAMAAAGTVAGLLPGAMLYLRDPAPPIDLLREAGVPLAVATDLNPGTSPVHDLWLAATLAVVTMRITVEEALLGVTRHAATAVGRPNAGWLGAGATGGVAVVRPPPGEKASAGGLIQHMGGNRLLRLVR